MGNCVWDNSPTPPLNHHTEDSYRELKEMGFNSVRFYLNYALFESDSNPYNYKESGFDWLDKNIAWAKKYDMGIILNMHFPQGGYQSQGNGMALWNDESNQQRLAALWTEIARRYADEPTIWGYGLLNEPFAPFKNSYEETAEQHFALMRRCVEGIRSVSEHQAIFVEKLMSIKFPDNSQVDWSWFTPENQFDIIDDDNIIYEFHFYEPGLFTHQNAEWAGNGGIYKTYPSDELIYAEYESYWVSCVRGNAKNVEGDWTYFETTPQQCSDLYNAAAATVNAPKTEEGAVYFDDIAVTEIAADGSKRVICTYDFDGGSISSFYGWSADGTGAMTWSENGRSGGAIKVQGTYSDFTATGEKFLMQEGCSYVVSGYMRKENTFSDSSIRIDFAKIKPNTAKKLDKSYLEQLIKPYYDFSQANNVPMYMGEFGVYIDGYEADRGGDRWVSDVIDICRKYGIGFNYHTFHENGFGIYKSNPTTPPAEKDRNLLAWETLRDKLDSEE